MSHKKNLLLSLLMLSIVQFIYPAPIPSDKLWNNTVNLKSEVGGAYLTFAGKFGGEITLADLKKYRKIGVAGCAKGSLITKFTIVINSKQKSLAFTGNSLQLDKEILNFFNSLQKGDYFEFKNVKAKLPTGSMVNVICRKFIVV